MWTLYAKSNTVDIKNFGRLPISRWGRLLKDKSNRLHAGRQVLVIKTNGIVSEWDFLLYRGDFLFGSISGPFWLEYCSGAGSSSSDVMVASVVIIMSARPTWCMNLQMSYLVHWLMRKILQITGILIALVGALVYASLIYFSLSFSSVSIAIVCRIPSTLMVFLSFFERFFNGEGSLALNCFFGIYLDLVEYLDFLNTISSLSNDLCCYLSCCA